MWTSQTPTSQSSSEPTGTLESLRATADRMFVYDILAHVFERLPDEEFIDAFRCKTVSGRFRMLGYDLSLEALDESASKAADSLRVEFGRLFVGPGPHIRRHGSLYQKRRGKSPSYWTKATGEVNRFMKTIGFKPKVNGRIPDHVSNELAIMRLLVKRQLAALEVADFSEAARYAELQRDFIVTHMSWWVPEFCRRVVRSGKLPFYREMARVAADFLDHELALFGIEPIDQQGD